MPITIIQKYFPDLTEKQRGQLERLPELYEEWNSKINVISRKDIENIVTNHLLHSLAIAKFITFVPNTRIFDVGTGGGLPGIPLAILFPECQFTLIDSIRKKISVATAIVESIELHNVQCIQSRAEELKNKCDFIVSRAAMSTKDLMHIAKKVVDIRTPHNAIPNGLIALKGGDLHNELAPYRKIATTEDLAGYFEEPFFETKKVIYIPL